MVRILLATYNGEHYIGQQIDSILAQTYRDFVLYVSDDGSTDRTWDILEEFERKHTGRVVVTRRTVNSGDAGQHFLSLMSTHQDDYLMLCDQDDVWLPDKIGRTLTKMQELERELGSATPILVHTDLAVVDEALNPVSSSFRRSMHADYTKTALRQVLIQNTVTGCTALYNRALANLLKRPPEFCVMHDWWLELVAATFGTIGYTYDTTVLYRQHKDNVVGAGNMRSASFLLRRFLGGNEIRRAIQGTWWQAESLLALYGDRLFSAHRQLVERYCGIARRGWLGRRLETARLGCWKNGLLRNIAYLIYL